MTGIGVDTFSNCSSLASVIIPSSVTTIEGNSFRNCTGLTNATIANGVTNIGGGSFIGCTSLTRITVPDSVTRIQEGTFGGCTSLTSVTIPNSVTSIGHFAFRGCISLTGVYLHGNAPDADDGRSVFDGSDIVTVYHLPGTTGWGTTFGDRPTALWSLPYPAILKSSPGFGVGENGFGFLISWATNAAVVVEASPNLATPVWAPVGTNILSAGTSQFTDPEWTHQPTRLYRLISR